ncbi:hypothetical protein H634G_00570 [Metarhizium anisopliae BRIP 53293]|uniref:Phosphoglycerate mutase family protein n=1 Tax=Metarhizium anisopliae BRIP 53293 TaxID=1291518 RepID=A0A0D9PD32_METAN|nr:hypothetical protein H634G_00570 [Metarhizium anisopliae BRIP 53293]KJK87131.1 hypothetical protein H633G_08984 [Metarhizium anisopliae BRIP 53284]
MENHTAVLFVRVPADEAIKWVLFKRDFDQGVNSPSNGSSGSDTYDSDQAQAYDQVTNRPHEAKWSHELIGGAAAFEAAKAYEDHVARNGHPDDHAKAKEILAGAIGFFVDREVETKGLDYIDREKAKRHAQQQAEQGLSSEGRW